METAGQSAMGALIHLIGSKDGRTFKAAVLKQRDLVVGSNENVAQVESQAFVVSSNAASFLNVCEKMLAVLERIEKKLDK